ncbi:MAG: metallophosphatase [Bacteroidaceae bacterium]|nr:metallophosphatase [Bacteroidaceae bacterium]
MKRTYIITAILLVIFGCNTNNLTIIHTSDTHSHTEPESSNKGGIVGRSLCINQIADSAGKDNTLLFDCGDFSQGSLYYNTYKGAFEIKTMNLLGYDAAAIGNHEFDFGLDNLARLINMAQFPFVCCNLDFTGTPCEGVVKPYTVIERSGHKIGVFGISPDLNGLVLKENFTGVKFLPPIESAQRSINALRNEGCDIIVCLSHLGWKIANRDNDEKLAAATEGIDIILGGHSHDTFGKPLRYKNKSGKEVILNHTGKNGRNIGVINIRYDVYDKK